MQIIELKPGDTLVIKGVDENTSDPHVYYRNENVLKHCRKLYRHPIARGHSTEGKYGTVCVQYDEDFYLGRINEKQVGVMFPANLSQNSWFIQEFEPDEYVESFLKAQNAWEPL